MYLTVTKKVKNINGNVIDPGRYKLIIRTTDKNKALTHKTNICREVLYHNHLKTYDVWEYCTMFPYSMGIVSAT